MLTAASLAIVLPSGAQATTADVWVEWTVTQDWGTGYQGAVRVTNNSDHAINPWSVTIPYANSITSVWDATITPTTGGFRFTGPSWSTSLPSGATRTFGFLGAPRGGNLTPTSCAIPAGTCAITGDPAASKPAPEPTVTPTPTPAPIPTPAPTPTTTAAPIPSAPAVSAGVTVGVKVSSDWGTGRTVDLTVTNTGTAPINGWTVVLPWSGSGISMWNATGTLAGGRLTATNLSWNASLAPGASATMGLTDSGTFVAPTTCTSTAGVCAIAGSGATTPISPTPTATPSPSASATASPSPKPLPSYRPKPGGYAGNKKLIAYYPAWATYARNYQVSDIPDQKLTHINYAFANIAGGKCVLGDSYADTDKAFAGDTWDQGAKRGNFNQLTKLKAANPGLKTMISIGGWTWSQNFSSAAATDASRQQFVSSCVSFMKQYGFDGIDIDWEYPVSGGLSGGTAADKQNYTALLAKFRSALDAQGAADGGKHYDLSIAAPAGPSIISNIEVAKIANSLDWLNLMSYDYHGSWDPITGHNAPMVVGSRDTATGFSITDSVDAYLGGGFPAAKLVLGVAFYGRGWENVSSAAAGLYQPGTPASVGTWESGVFDYTDIRANYLPTMTRYWDSQAQVPYLYDPVRKLWISYDDPESMKVKADYIKAKGLGGAMAWELSGDRNQELIDTLVANL